MADSSNHESVSISWRRSLNELRWTAEKVPQIVVNLLSSCRPRVSAVCQLL